MTMISIALGFTMSIVVAGALSLLLLNALFRAIGATALPSKPANRD